MRWGGFRSRRPTLFRPRRRLRPGRWAIALAVLVGLVGGVLLALDPPAAPPRGSLPPAPPVQRDLPGATMPPARTAPNPPVGGAVITGRASIADGDTIEVGGRRVRLHGIDAPESHQMCYRNGHPWHCGRDATAALERLIGGRTVTCTELEVDRYGRSVARCLVNGQDVNAWMVRNGWAVAYRRYSEAYSGDEAEARAARRGIWSSRFEMRDGLRHLGR